MKKAMLVAIAIAIAVIFAASPVLAASFVNGGFEDGNLGGWTGGGGSWFGAPPAPVPPSTYNGGLANNALMSGGVDPITGAARVYNGGFSARANDSSNNYSVSTIRQSVLGYSDPHIFFEWNAVLESSHGLTDSDYFSLTLRDDTTGTTVVNRGYSSAGSIGGGTTGVTWTAFGSWFSSGWVVEDIDLALLGLVGHDFTLTLLASDCPYGGHAGYVYLDGFGSIILPPGVPGPSTIILLVSGLLGVALYGRQRMFKA